ncbi:MAG: preQ(1) synthase, partial [Methyloceanibacter sp.]
MAAKTSKPKQLGKPVPLPRSPEEALLERVPNPHPDTLYATRFSAPEFTCLCPITGQPDFAHFVIDYAPKRWLIESKSFKLYLASFRNTGAFHEDVTVGIGKRIVELITPAYLRIGGYWYPRGGIPIDVFWQ